MKIVVSPGLSFHANPQFGTFNDELRKRGHELFSPRLSSLFQCDLFHVNFPQHMVSENRSIIRALAAATAMLGFMLVVKLRRRKIIWSVHNVQPLRDHHPLISSLYMTIVRGLMDGLIFLNRSSREKFVSLHPRERGKPALRTSSPAPVVALLDAAKKAKYLRQLGLEPNHFLVGILGDIKLYKNFDIARMIPRTLDDGRETMLVVAGRADNIDATLFEDMLKTRKCVRIDRRLKDDELEALIQIVDVVFLPYAWGWNSAFLRLVLSCHQRTLASNLPIFTEMQSQFGEKWIKTFDLSAEDQAGEIGKAINEFSVNPNGDIECKQLEDNLEMHSLARYVDQVESFYHAVQSTAA
jgi:hypothetical protein